VTDEDLKGLWSEPTDAVSMPADVQPFVIGSLPASPKSGPKVAFDVIRFNPEEGATVPRHFEAGPGEIIGDVRSADIPVSDGTGKKTKSIDFTSHQLVLDVMGGLKPLPAGFPGAPLDQPAVALLLQPDGSLVVRSQADDIANEVRKDIEANYRREIRESNKERQSSLGSGYMGMGGMMPGMGGMMGMPRGR
jgi:hypothetical protein